MAFPTYVSTTAGTQASGTSQVITLPTLVANDLMILVFVTTEQVTHSTPAGWTLIISLDDSVPASRFSVYKRMSDGLDSGGTATITLGGTSTSASQIIRITSWANDLAAVYVSTLLNNTSPDPPSLTPAPGAADYLWIGIVGDDNAVVATTPPANYTNATFNQTGATDACIATFTRALNAASEDPGATTGGTSFGNYELTLAVGPAPPPPPLNYLNIEQVDPLREVFNRIEATVTPYQTAGLAVLWALSNEVPFSLSPGATVIYTATVSSGYVDPWTTPVLGTDIVQTGVSNSDIGLTVIKSPTKMTIFLANNHATTATTISVLQARGIAVTPLNSYTVFSVDAASIAAYNPRTYPLPSPWYQNQPYAQAACDYFISLKKDPHPTITFTVPGIVSLTFFTLAVQLRLSQRISLVAASIVTQLGIGQDFFIESIAHSWAPETGLMTTFEVSPASVAAHYWQLDVDQLGVTTVLAF